MWELSEEHVDLEQLAQGFSAQCDEGRAVM